MKIIVTGIFTLTVAFASLLSLPATAEPMGTQAGGPPGANGGMHRRGPPKEALDACSGKQENAACTFTAPRGTITGACHTVPSGQFACVPADRMGGGRMGGMQGGPNSRPQ